MDICQSVVLEALLGKGVHAIPGGEVPGTSEVISRTLREECVPPRGVQEADLDVGEKAENQIRDRRDANRLQFNSAPETHTTTAFPLPLGCGYTRAHASTNVGHSNGPSLLHIRLL